MTSMAGNWCTMPVTARGAVPSCCLSIRSSPSFATSAATAALSGGSSIQVLRAADIDIQLHWGLGVRYALLDWLHLRAEARHVMSDALDAAALPFTSNVELTVGGVENAYGRFVAQSKV